MSCSCFNMFYVFGAVLEVIKNYWGSITIEYQMAETIYYYGYISRIDSEVNLK